MKMNFFKNRRFKHGSLATVITIGFIVAIVIINVIATILLERFPLNIDLTKDKRFALTKDSITYIEKLKTDVKVIVCVEENLFKTAGEQYKQAYEIIKNYTKYNNNIKLEFVDLTNNPTFAQKYPTENIQTGDIIIESSIRTKKFSSSEFFSVQQTEQGQQQYSSQAEQLMTSSIMYVVDKEPVTVSLLSGQDNADVSGYINLLEKNNYMVKTQNLLTEDINKDAAFVILAAPKTDINAAQVKKLNEYLDNDGKFGKSLIFVSSYESPVGPVLKNFLAEWGMDVSPDVIYETNSSNVAYNNNYYMVNKVTDQDLEAKLKNKNIPIVSSFANPVVALFDKKDNRRTTILSATSDTTVLVPTDATKDFDPSKQKQSSHNTIVKGTREKYIGSELKQSTVIALGSNTMINTDFIANAQINNGDMMITLTNDITKKEDAVKILPIEFNQETITISKGQVTAYTLVFVFIIPIAVIIMAVVIWLRRRHL